MFGAFKLSNPTFARFGQFRGKDRAFVSVEQRQFANTASRMLKFASSSGECGLKETPVPS